MIKLPFFSKVGQYFILHTGNHNNTGNPHSQYCKHLYSTSIAAEANMFTKIATIRVEQNRTYVIQFQATSYGVSWSTPLNSITTIFIRTFNGNMINICTTGSTNLIHLDNTCVVLSNNTVDIYSKIYNSNDYNLITPLTVIDNDCITKKYSDIANITWLENQQTISLSDFNTQYPNAFITTDNSICAQGATLPYAGSIYQGRFFLKIGEWNVPDELYCCLKKSDNNFAWVQVK